jgi:MFS transporter, DHA3 family, macrolide efflux protein
MTNFQKMVPGSMRARFFSVLTLIAQLAVPLGAAVFGFLLDKTPVHYLILTVGLILLGGTIWFIAVASSEVFEPSQLVDL